VNSRDLFALPETASSELSIDLKEQFFSFSDAFLHTDSASALNDARWSHPESQCRRTAKSGTEPSAPCSPGPQHSPTEHMCGFLIALQEADVSVPPLS